MQGDENRSPSEPETGPPGSSEPETGPPASSEPDQHASPAKKRVKQPPPDRLSELPDLALVNILSHMHVEEAARTTILSKRFNSLWNSVTSLNFSEEYSGKRGDLFVSFVDTVLGFHSRKDIEKLSVKFRYGIEYSKIVDGWIKFATNKKVKSLNLDFTQNHGVVAGFEHRLPKFLCNDENLVELVTCCCQFVPGRVFNWSSLKLLSITRTKLSEDLISRVLSLCPVLETLELRDWTGFDKLKIKSVSLRVLRIIGEQLPKFVIQPQDEIVLEISGPNLMVLEVSGALYRTKVRLRDVGSLVRAVLDFEIRPQGSGIRGFYKSTSWFDLRDQDIARDVLESLCLVEALTVGGWFIKVLSTCETYNLASPWSERKSLTLFIPVVKWDHLGIASLLQSSLYLEKLVIRLSYCSDTCSIQHSHVSFNNPDKEYFWRSWTTISKCPLVHLKTVKVVNFQASCETTKSLFQFLEFLLGNSKVLEEIVLQTSRYVTRVALDEALKLLSVPTASPDAVVRFEPPHFWVDPLCMY